MTATDLLVLHTLRCIGAASTGRLADAAGLDDSVVESNLIDLGSSGLVTFSAGTFGGWMLTENGRGEVALRIAIEVSETDRRDELAETFSEFLELNPVALGVCSAWQLRTDRSPVVLNDHRDPLYDESVLDRLRSLDSAVDPVIERLASVLPRFGRYRDRLTESRTRAESGETSEVADSITSYHSVWFQLHEDLLATLGLKRS